MRGVSLRAAGLTGLFLSLIWIGPFQASPELIRGPHVQMVTPTSAVVSWTTSGPGPAAVEFEYRDAFWRHVKAGTRIVASGEAGRYDHTLVVSGLTPGTSYEYRILTQGIDLTPSATAVFTTATTADTFTFVALGDSRSASPGAKALAQEMARHPFDFAIITGDLANHGREDEYDSQYFAIYRDLIRRVPFYPVTGNHDVASGSARAYLDAFNLPENGRPEGLAERVYSFDWGNAHFVGLDTALPLGLGTPQHRWLVADLAATRQPWKFVFLHRPPYSSGNHGGSADVRDALVPLFDQYGVDAVFAGHDHSYERTVPLLGGNPDSRGVSYIVTGGGGSGLYGVGKSDFTAASRSVYHFVRLQVQGCRLEGQAIDAEGQVFDTFVIDKCTAG